MKKVAQKSVFLVMACVMLSSCYVQTHVVGTGGNGSQSVTKWNHYLINGLAPVGVSKPEEMAGGAKDYTVTNSISFINGLVSGLTLGIYSPTTTTVTK